jgi:hypothetical protein
VTEQEQIFVLAALMWDVPALVRSDEPGAEAFVEGLRPPPHHREIEEGDAPLLIAARGLRLEYERKPEEAMVEYRRLLGGEGWIPVLGGFLMCWSEATRDPEWVTTVAETTRGANIEYPYVRAHLLGTLAMHALDHDLGELFASLLNEAADTAPPRSSLRRALRISRSNWLGVQLTPEDFEIPDAVDPLVDYDWIDDFALTGAREELVAMLKSRSASPWSWTIGGGRTPIDNLVAAERQVTWAGALWKRSSVRQQLAAQILNDPNRDAYTTLYALVMWLLSRGGDISQILSFAESSFDSATADRLIGTLEGQKAVQHVRDTALPEAAAELWDLLSPETTDRLLSRYKPRPGNPLDGTVRRFWGGASLSAPKVWRRHFDALEAEQQIAVLETLPVYTLDALPKTLARKLISAAERDPEPLSPYARAATLLLRRRLGRPTSLTGDDRVRAAIAAEIALRVPTALPAEEYTSAEAVLREGCKQAIESARQGAMSFGGRSALRDLARVARARGKADRKTVDLLMNVAFDVSLPGDMRLDALLALAELSAAGLLSRRRLEKIHDAPDESSVSFFSDVSPDLLRSARLAARAKQLDEGEQILLFTLSRNPDARVRQFICETAGRFLAFRTSPPVEAALLAGLFDPEERVLTAALGSLESAKLTKLTEDAVAERLVRLYENYGRNVRSHAVRAARKHLAKRPADRRLVRIITSGATDRSWLVRDAAEQALV